LGILGRPRAQIEIETSVVTCAVRSKALGVALAVYSKSEVRMATTALLPRGGKKSKYGKPELESRHTVKGDGSRLVNIRSDGIRVQRK